MSKKKVARPKRQPAERWLIPVTGVVVIVMLGGLAAWWQRPAGDAIAALKDSDTAFSVPTHVGQPAPAFTAINVDGQPYTVKPGDGRPKVIVFYMGVG